MSYLGLNFSPRFSGFGFRLSGFGYILRVSGLEVAVLGFGARCVEVRSSGVGQELKLTSSGPATWSHAILSSLILQGHVPA